MNKHVFSIVIFITVLLALSSCSKIKGFLSKNEHPLVGEWMRVGDDIEGLRITIQKNDSTYKGVITGTTESLSRMFPINEAKWLDLRVADSVTCVGKDIWKSENNGVIQRIENKVEISLNNGVLLVKGLKSSGEEFRQQYIRAPKGKAYVFRSPLIEAGEGSEEQFDICLYENAGYIINYSGSELYAKAWFLPEIDSTGNISISSLNAKMQYKELSDWAYQFKGQVFAKDSIVGTMKLKSAEWTYDKCTFTAVDLSLNGKWHYEEWLEGPYYTTLNIITTNDSISGSVDVQFGDDPSKAEHFPIKFGCIDGNRVSFETEGAGDFGMKYVFDGYVQQNTYIKGDLSRNSTGSGKVVMSEIVFTPHEYYKSRFR